MEIHRLLIVDVFYNEKEQPEADNEGMQLIRAGYQLEVKGSAGYGTNHDYCDQYVKTLGLDHKSTKNAWDILKSIPSHRDKNGDVVWSMESVFNVMRKYNIPCDCNYRLDDEI
jgi:hypothetical protein